MVTLAYLIPPPLVNNQLDCLQPVGVCVKFSFIYLRIAMETAKPGLPFSFPYRVTFLSCMYFTTGVSKRTFGMFFFHLIQLPHNQNAVNLSDILTFCSPYKRIMIHPCPHFSLFPRKNSYINCFMLSYYGI